MCDYYEKNAAAYAAETFSADMGQQYRAFLLFLAKKARILDIGSGSGRDACFFEKQGYQVTAMEPSGSLCREIRKVFTGEIICCDIQHYKTDQMFDGIWACASLIHLPEQELLSAVRKIAGILKENGVFYCSGKHGINTGTAQDGRFFQEFTEELVRKIQKENPCLILEQMWYTQDAAGRESFQWLNIILKKRKKKIKNLINIEKEQKQ